MGKGEVGHGDGSGGCGCCGTVDCSAPDPVHMKRWVTDVPFLLAFGTFWVGMIVCAGMGFSKGDITRLLYFVDYNGNRCGQGALTDYKYSHWTHWGNVGTNICVKECPLKDVKFTLQDNFIGSNGPNIGYVSKSESNLVCLTTYLACVSQQQVSSLVGSLFSSSCCTFSASPAPNGLFICVPEALQAGATSQAQEYTDGANTMMASATGDLLVGWYIIVTAGFLALFMSFVYTYILKYSAACFVYSVVALSNITMIAATGICFYMYDKYKKAFDDSGLSSDNQMSVMMLMALCVCGVIAIVLLCMTICMCKQIRIAVGVIEAACEAIQSMPLIVIYPLFSYLFLMCFMVYWIFVAAYMASAGEYVKDPLTGVYTMAYEDSMQKAMFYHFFGLLWQMAFIRHMTILVLAGAFGAWYWTPQPVKTAGEFSKENPSPILSSLCRSVLYHTGTVAFGSFIIAVLQMVQYILEYIKKRQDSRFLKWIIAIIQACVKCFERIMEYISKCAYIVTACKGNMFCTAAWESFKFLWNHLGQHAVVNWISAFLLGLGKIFVVATVCCVTFVMASANSNISSPYILLLVCLIIAYLVASLFLGVVDTGIDTILVCFCWELDANGAMENAEGEKMIYGTPGLTKFIAGAQATADALKEGSDKPGASAEAVTEVQPAATPVDAT